MTVRVVGAPILRCEVLIWSPTSWKSLSATACSVIPRSGAGRYLSRPSTMIRPDMPPAVWGRRACAGAGGTSTFPAPGSWEGVLVGERLPRLDLEEDVVRMADGRDVHAMDVQIRLMVELVLEGDLHPVPGRRRSVGGMYIPLYVRAHRSRPARRTFLRSTTILVLSSPFRLTICAGSRRSRVARAVRAGDGDTLCRGPVDSFGWPSALIPVCGYTPQPVRVRQVRIR